MLQLILHNQGNTNCLRKVFFLREGQLRRTILTSGWLRLLWTTVWTSSNFNLIQFSISILTSGWLPLKSVFLREGQLRRTNLTSGWLWLLWTTVWTSSPPASPPSLWPKQGLNLRPKLKMLQIWLNKLSCLHNRNWWCAGKKYDSIQLKVFWWNISIDQVNWNVQICKNHDSESWEITTLHVG